MKKILKVILIIIGLITGDNIFCQQNYELLFLQGEYDQILEVSRELSSPEEFFWHAVVLNKKGEPMRAIRILEMGLENFKDDPTLELLVSDLYFNNGQFPKAKPLLIKHQDSTGKFIQYIEVLEFERNYTDAISLLEEKLADDPDNIRYSIHLGDNYSKLDSLARAAIYFEKAFALNSQDQLTAIKLVNIHMKMKSYRRTVEICDMVLLADSTSKSFIRSKGMASFNLDNFEIAEECFSYLLAQGDSGKFILKHLGISELNIMDWHTGREHLLMAYALDSNDFETCYFLGKAFLNSMTQARGLYYLDRADSLLQPDPRVLAAVYLERHSIYAALNQYKKAIDCYKEAYMLDPRVEYIFHIASMYGYGLKDKRKALEYFELFISELHPKPEEDSPRKEDSMTISMREAAERAITQLKEELFFEGEDLE